MMRTSNSIKNVIVAIVGNSVALLLGFISQKYFINILGINYSGLNGVLTNLISMLSIVELGLGTAIIYHLYKPVSNQNIEEIKSLLNLYKKSYYIIALIIALLGIILIPFLKIFINVDGIKENIYIIYTLFLMDTVFSYLISYKRSIIYANQKNRIVDSIHIVYTLLLNIFQILILIYTKNFILYLLLKIVLRILENIIISRIADTLYPYIKEATVKPLDKKIKDEIKKMIYGQLYHQIGGRIVMGTDNIIMSTFLGLSITGIYSNYSIIANAANTILSQAFNSVTGSVGNLLVENDKNKTYNVYYKINFLNFFLFATSSIGMVFCINDFIYLWLNNIGLLLPESWVILFSFNYYLQGMRRTLQTFASGAGICYENRFVPVIESIVNLFFSIILVIYLGFYGIIIGTIISTFVLYFYGFPKYIYTPLFGKKYISFIKQILGELVILFIMFILNYFILIKLFSFSQSITILGLVIKILLIIIVNISIIVFFYHKNTAFIFYKNLISKKLYRKN